MTDQTFWYLMTHFIFKNLFRSRKRFKKLKMFFYLVVYGCLMWRLEVIGRRMWTSKVCFFCLISFFSAPVWHDSQSHRAWNIIKIRSGEVFLNHFFSLHLLKHPHFVLILSLLRGSPEERIKNGKGLKLIKTFRSLLKNTKGGFYLQFAACNLIPALLLFPLFEPFCF